MITPRMAAAQKRVRPRDALLNYYYCPAIILIFAGLHCPKFYQVNEHYYEIHDVCWNISFLFALTVYFKSLI